MRAPEKGRMVSSAEADRWEVHESTKGRFTKNAGNIFDTDEQGTAAGCFGA